MSGTHGPWCNARTWPTLCPRCKTAVFYFSCDCGSGVFFAALGAPWPVHDCDTDFARNLTRTKGTDGGITVRISEDVTVRRPPLETGRGFDIDRKTLEKAKKQKDFPIVAVKPEKGSGMVSVTGILREKTQQADPFKLFIESRTTMAEAFLGPLAKGKWGRITIHTPSAEKDLLLSYTIWVKSGDLGSSANRKGITVSADIKPHPLPDQESVWVCTDYKII